MLGRLVRTPSLEATFCSHVPSSHLNLSTESVVYVLPTLDCLSHSQERQNADAPGWCPKGRGHCTWPEVDELGEVV